MHSAPQPSTTRPAIPPRRPAVPTAEEDALVGPFWIEGPAVPAATGAGLPNAEWLNDFVSLAQGFRG